MRRKGIVMMKMKRKKKKTKPTYVNVNNINTKSIKKKKFFTQNIVNVDKPLTHINHADKFITIPINIKEASPQIFILMLECIYTSQIKTIGKDGSRTLIQLMQLAKKYEIQTLRNVCESLLHSRMTPRDALSLYSKYPDITENIVEENISSLVHSNEFLDLDEECIIRIVKSNVIDISELELFNAVIKWCVKECNRRNIKDSHENRREVLKNILIHIRFPLFTTEQIASDVRTSGALLDDQMVLLFTWLGKKASLKGDDLLVAQNEFRNQQQEDKFPWLFDQRGSKRY